MKAKIIPIIPLILLIFLINYACEDSTYKEYKGNAPVYMSYADLRSAVTMKEDIPLNNPGKIYFKDNYIFVVEELKGVHVFDNVNPASPVKMVFVQIPGVVDISISGNKMYADSFVDLVVLDVEDINNIVEAGRVKDVLPYTVPPVDNEFPTAYIDQEKGVVVDWELKTIREKIYQ
ncbi:MAG: hypothetical protein QG611_407, partial [Bacteroidota bacterium]|nr:hypothetical protein [Bacteroidota bacterium]